MKLVNLEDIFIVIALIENSEDIDYFTVVQANTKEQALQYCLNKAIISSTQEYKITSLSDGIPDARMVKVNNET